MLCKKNISSFVLLLFLVGSVSASSVVCTIIEDRVLVEIELTGETNAILPEEYSLLEINDKMISFISREFLKKDGDWIFVLPRAVDSTYDLKVYLPHNYILSGDLVYPKGYEISSDGASIILDWENLDEAEVVVFYEGVEDSYLWFWIGILVLIVVGFIYFKIQKKRFVGELEQMKKEVISKKNGSKKNLVSLNLFGEERRIVEFLVNKKSCWMKELVRELGISKVMVSRKVRSLMEKGLIEKESFGRESRISLKKNSFI